LRSEYSYILVAIGGNDIIRFHDVHGATESLREALQALPKTEKLILHSAGNVGASTLFPWFVRPFHTSLTISYHQAFTQVVRENGGTYVNLYLDPKVDPFTSEPHIYLSKDGLHPSSAGYKLWFESIVAHI
jgi:lysophospholipase L1-like esterase